MNSKLLIICGPTATGKSSLGISMAKKFNGEIISADSRQVYKDMDIGTGKEWGEGVKIYGYDLVGPKEEFSVSKYLKFADHAIQEISNRGKTPILVGGTGLYIKGVVDGIPTVDVPINNELRKNFELLSVTELYDHLSQLDSFKAGSMNSSDKKNPRRLIRAIEVATWALDNSKKEIPVIKKAYDTLFIGLTASSQELGMRIEGRVKKRIEMGMKDEIKRLLENGVDWSMQSMQALGYRQYRDYFEGDVPEEIFIDEWTREEIKYARRQITWFKKEKRINWFDVSEVEYQKKVENMIELWYSKHESDAKKN